jgi:diguanylate cyclase (GGDEF)-like protein
VDEETKYIRHAKAVNEDGSILMSSNIPRGSEVRIAYGDPRRIIEHTKKTEQEVKVFSPQVVSIFNCMGRMLFWGDQADVEVTEISKFITTTGFSALGEILRYKRITLLNNLSIVTVAMREGKPIPRTDVTIDTVTDDSNMPITARLAIFINTITEELMEKNEQLNEMLHNASHDALTELLNRGAIERIIYDTNEKMAGKGKKWHLIMIDVDDFKMVNDNFGHQEGDRTLKSMAKYLSYQIMPLRNVQVGRWGGEEFMILLPEYSDAEAKMIAENIRRDMVNAGGNMAGRITISVGVTSHRKNESVMETIKRVDSLLYRAKSNGKDQVCSDL